MPGRVVNGHKFFPKGAFSPSFVMCLKELIILLRQIFRRQNDAEFAAHKGVVSGSRFNGNTSITERALGAIWVLHGLDKHEGAVPSDVVRQIEAQEQLYLGVWAWEALRDAAETDYWYMHEKLHE